MISDTYSKSIHQLISIIFIYACSSIAYLIRFDTFYLADNYLLITTIFTISSILCLSVSGFHEQAHSYSTLKKAHSLVSSTSIAALITTLILYFSKTGQDHSRIWFAFTLVGSNLSLIVLQIFSDHLHLATSRSKNIIIAGSTEETDQLKQMLDGSTHSSITIIERVTLNSADESTTISKTLKQTAKFIEAYRLNSKNIDAISEIWLTCSAFSKAKHNEIDAIFAATAVKIVYIPKIPDLPFSVSIETSNGIPTINSDFTAQQKTKDLIKFFEDKTIAITALFLCSIPMMMIALLIKLDSPGPIFYRQSRYGSNAKEFKIWKFRTMGANKSEVEFQQASRDDTRVTRIGKILRKTSLDELPQLFNVINGTMSIVGPRPHPTALNEQYRTKIKDYMQRHTFKPGITGLAQVNGFRGELLENSDMDGRINYDLKYINNWSLTLDMVIILKTFSHVLTTNKAY